MTTKRSASSLPEEQRPLVPAEPEDGGRCDMHGADITSIQSNACCPPSTGFRFLPQISSKSRCLKNLAFHSMSCCLVFTSFMTFQSMDSTLNSERGLGAASFAVLYTGLIASCVFAPAVLRVVSYKQAMLTCFCAQFFFSLAHYYPEFYTLIPCSLLVGLTLGPFWTAQGLYVLGLSVQYSRATGMDFKKINGRFYGVFNFFYMSAQKFGNLLESIMLGGLDGRLVVNGAAMEHNLSTCGAKYCSSQHNQTRDKLLPEGTDLSQLYILFGILAALCAVGIFGKVVFVDSIKISMLKRNADDSSTEGAADDSRGCSVGGAVDDITNSLLIHKEKALYLLVPLFFYNGLQQGFIFGDYTKSFVNCALGISQIGFVMLAYGYSDALTSLFVGWLERYTGRVSLFLAAGVIQVTFVFVMLFWRPLHGGAWPIYVIPAFWAVGDSVWQTTTSSMIGARFTSQSDAAFASFRLWQAAGLATAFSYNHSLCTWMKLYILLAVLVVALVAVCTLELHRRRKVRNDYQTL